MGVISRDDWSLDRRAQQAEQRHKHKVQEAIRNNLSDTVANEGLVVSDGRKNVRVPIQSLDEPHFYFNQHKQRHAGQGEGTEGQVIGRAKAAHGTSGAGSAPGEGAGEFVYEAEVTVDDIADVLFAELKLPNLQPKQKQQVMLEDVEWTDLRTKGIRSNLDRKHTFYEALKRSSRTHEPFRIVADDLRFKTWEDVEKPHHGAVILAMMDVSGSMGEFEKYVARTFFFWMERFLDKHYPHVEIRYLVHHVDAYEVDQQEFFTLRESGGTRCSSVYDLALQVMRDHYRPEDWNIYPIHVSDGDNLSTDNDASVAKMEELCSISSLAAFLEVHSTPRESTLTYKYGQIEKPNFRLCTVQSREGILGALRYLFREEGESA